MKRDFKILTLLSKKWSSTDNISHASVLDQITVMYYDKEVFSDAYAAVMDSKNRYLYVSHTGGISKIDTKASVWSLELVAGTNLNSSNFQRSQSKDGPLTTARFGGK